MKVINAIIDSQNKLFNRIQEVAEQVNTSVSSKQVK